MTERMEQAIAALSKLSLDEQDVFAAWILEELSSEQRWADLFASSQDVLAELANEALVERRSLKTTLD
ncbi:MAG: hypothetical protein SF029_21695 [bacterium]|nr:hypothetical protein [bacterium]